MKSLLVAVLFAATMAPLSAAIVYSDLQNLSVDWDDLEGIYINMNNDEVANAWPDDFDEAPWINITLGGYGIFNSELLRPWANSAGDYDPELTSDYYVNLAPGTLLDGSGAFVTNGYGSIHHMGSAGDSGKFVALQSGYLGFAFQNTAGGDTHYGWLRFIPDGTDAGTIVEWAYNDTPGEAIQVGAVPEPSTGAILLVAFGAAAFVRRRARSV